MPDWRALFCFWKQRRATSHPHTHTPHPTPPATNREVLIPGPNPIPPLPADTPNPNPASRTPPLANAVDQHQSLSPSQTPDAQNTTIKIPTTVVNGFILALSLLKEAVTGVQVPGLEAAVSGVVKVVDIIVTVRSNDEGLKDLSGRISKVANAVLTSGNFHPTGEVSEALRLRLESFLNGLELLLLKVNITLSDRNLVSRTANSQAYKDAIMDINARMDRLISQFSVEGIIHIELKVDGVDRKVGGIDHKVEDIKEAQTIQEYEALIEKIPRVHARYHDTATKPSRPCHPGTRIGLLQVINKWIEGQTREDESNMDGPSVDEPNDDGSSEGGFGGLGYTEDEPSMDGPSVDEPNDDGSSEGGFREFGYSEDEPSMDGPDVDGPGDTPILWLCGEAGVGKTTVAHTIAKEQDTLERLGASFFFSRHDHDRQAPRLLFSSIAYQLARFDRGVWGALAEVLKPDPDIVNRGLAEQFTKLVLGPLSRSGMASSRTVVIVIDGLDECSDPASVLDALALGAENVSVRLRILVSSRPYAVIQSKFKNTPLYHLTTQNHFHNISPKTLSNDVAVYLTWSLREIASRSAHRNLPSPWPTAAELAKLIRRASGLFIIGTTYMKYIDDPFADDPAAQLKRILSRKRGIGSSQWAELDALYDQVLDDLRQSLKTTHELGVARDIIEFVILAESEMSLTACSGFMCMEPSEVRSVLRRLTAVILLPEDEDGTITPFHASFGEYIQDEARCSIREFAVDTMSAHNRIAGRCISLIASTARAGIIGVEYHTQDIPHHLSYAIRSLADHVHTSSHKPAGGDGQTFTQSGIWTWLNLMLMPWYEGKDVARTIEHLEGYVKKAGFASLLDVEGLRVDTTASVGRLVAAKHMLAINRTSEIPLRLATSAIESFDVRQSKGTQIIILSSPADEATVGVLEDSDILKIVVGARRWNMHGYPNFFIESVTVDLDSPTKVEIAVSTPHDLREFYNMAQYLERTPNLDTMSRVRLALEVAKEVRYLHETSPLHCHGRLILETVLVTVEGKPFFGPPEWMKPTSPEASMGWNPFNSLSKFESWHYDRNYWSEPGDWRSMLYSLRVRRTTEIWDFGCMLFGVMTTVNPLYHYGTLAKSRPALGYIYKDYTFWHGDLEAHVYQARYETAVSLLVDTLEGPEEVKTVLKGCWAIKPQDRSSIQVVVEQLEVALEAIRRAAKEVP